MRVKYVPDPSWLPFWFLNVVIHFPYWKNEKFQSGTIIEKGVEAWIKKSVTVVSYNISADIFKIYTR